MSSEQESVCGREQHKVTQMSINQGVPCITKHPLFELYCLNRAVLDLDYTKLRYFCPVDAGDMGPQERYRYTAYRQFVWWIHKKIGRDNRVALLSCVVTRIRTEFPSVDGNYVGFKEHNDRPHEEFFYGMLPLRWLD